MTNVSIAINISMKLCFVSVNGPREPYLLDKPRIYIYTNFIPNNAKETLLKCRRCCVLLTGAGAGVVELGSWSGLIWLVSGSETHFDKGIK
jgi:hypothetical protein